MPLLKNKASTYLFFLSLSILIFFSAGFIEAEDSWLYTSVSRNLYYHRAWQAAPNEYSSRLNVNFNSRPRADGTWYAGSGSGYSLLMVPAAILSDLYHQATGLPVSTHFPLVDDWSFHLSVGWFHALWGAVLVVLIYQFARDWKYDTPQSILIAGGSFFLSNLFPLAGDSFAHILLLDFFMLGLVSVNRWVFKKSRPSLILGVISWVSMLFIYNQSAVLLLISGMIYLLVLMKQAANINWRSWWLWLILVLLVLSFIAFNSPLLLRLALSFKPVVMIDGVWGLVFSPGKSIFLYSPLLLIPLIFWRRIKPSHFPQLVMLVLMFVLYVVFYGQAYLLTQSGMVNPIWNGGLNWGVRYMSPVVLVGMILAWRIFFNLSHKEKIWVAIPLAVISLYVQLLGVVLPYQTQHRGLPASIEIAGREFDRYNYTAFIPHFSPLYIQSKELVRRVMRPDHRLFISDNYYYDHGQEPWGAIEDENNRQNYWRQWQLKSSIYENTFDFWWLRPFYYLDLPHGLVLTLLIINLTSISFFWKKLAQFLN